MKKMLLLLTVVCATVVVAQDQVVSWKAEIRIRSEADMRDFNNTTPANLYSLLRVRLAADMTPAEKVSVFLQVQDSRTLGATATTLSNASNLDLHQGYIRLEDFVMDGLSVQAGRMEISLGTQRLVGAVGWNNVGRSFDGVRFTSEQSFGRVDILALNTAESSVAPGAATPGSVTYARETGQFFGGIYAALKPTGPVTLDLFALYEANRTQSVPGANDLSRMTLGGYGRGDQGSVWYQAEVAYQTGKVSTRDLSAYLLAGMVGMNLGADGLQKIGIGADILSGTPTSATTKSHTFIPAYYTGHKFHGFMDYFVGIPAQGLHDYIAIMQYQLRPGVAISATGHLFLLAEASASGKDLGREIDIVTSWKYNGSTTFLAGMSAFLPGGVMKALYGASDAALWGFLAVTVSL